MSGHDADSQTGTIGAELVVNQEGNGAGEVKGDGTDGKIDGNQ